MNFGSAKDSSESSPSESSGFSSGSSSGVAEACPLIVWAFVTSNTNDWVEHTDRHIELRMQASENCSGTNFLPQSGTATSNIVVPAGKKMVLDWTLKATVEAQDAGFDIGKYQVDGVDVASLGSQGNQQGCVNVTREESGTTELTAGAHSLAVSYDTVDALFHTDESGVEFEITACSIVPA